MKIKNLVFEGGGVKGIAYGGALMRLQELEKLNDIENIAGTSAGAITATLLAIGYKPEEISKIMSSTNFKDFADDSPGFLKDIFRFLFKFGWHKGDRFEQWISSHIQKKLDKKDITFSELKNLFIIGSNLTAQRSEIYSADTTPQMSVVKAVRISMSIPFYFQAVFSKQKDVLVDGGVIRNYPINLFDTIHPDGISKPNPETLGFRLTDDNPIETSRKIKITGLKSFTWSLISLMQEAITRVHVKPDDWKRTIAIDTTGVGVTEFDIEVSKVQLLLANGKKAVDKYLESVI